MRELPPPYVTNERYKSVSRTFFQLGSALLAAALAKSYAAGSFSPETAGWFLISIVLIWSGWIVLGLLESEK